MRFISNNRSMLVWLSLLLAATITAAAAYFIFLSDTRVNDAAVSPETRVEAPMKVTKPAQEDAGTATTITTADGEFGPMLFDGNGQAIYIWELEESATAECYGDCADAWPPVLTDGAPIATGGVNGAMIGTTKRSDGTTQVTYNGHPLYYYAHEEPGEVKCHNISTHGGLWWVITPSGVRAA